MKPPTLTLAPGTSPVTSEQLETAHAAAARLGANLMVKVQASERGDTLGHKLVRAVQAGERGETLGDAMLRRVQASERGDTIGHELVRRAQKRDSQTIKRLTRAGIGL